MIDGVKEWKIVNYSQSKGLNTAISPFDIGDADFSSIQNMRFSRFGFGPRLGMNILGTHDNNLSGGIKSLYAFGKTGGKWLIVCNFNTVAEWFDRVNEEWHTILSGLTSDKRISWAPYNKSLMQLTDAGTATVADNLVFGNGEEQIRFWGGAASTLASPVTSASTEIDVPAGEGVSWPASGDGLLEGTDTFSWTGRTTDQLTGVTGITSNHATGAELIQIVTAAAVDLPRGNIMHSSMGKIVMSKDNNIRVYYSATNDTLDTSLFTSGNNFGDPGFEDFTEGNGAVQAINGRSGKWYVWKQRGIFPFFETVFSATSSTSNKQIKRDFTVEGEDQGVASPLALTTGDNGLDYFISPRGQIRSFNGQDIRSLTNAILPSIKNFVTTEAAIGYDPKENLIYASMRGLNAGGNPVSSNDTTIVYDATRQAISIWKGKNISCYAYDPQDRKMLAGDAVNPNVLEMNIAGTFSDDIGEEERVPVQASATTKRFNFALPTQEKQLPLYFVQGWILPTANIDLIFQTNDGGVKKREKKSLTGKTTNPYVFTRPANSFGTFEFSKMAFGNELSDIQIEGMNPFAVFIELPITLGRNVEVVFSSTTGTANGYWISNAGFGIADIKDIDISLKI